MLQRRNIKIQLKCPPPGRAARILAAALFCVSIVAIDSVIATADQEGNGDHLAALLTSNLAFTLNEGVGPTPISQNISGVARWNDAIKVEIRGAIDQLATDRMASDDVRDLPDFVFKQAPDELASAVTSTLESLGQLQSHVKVGLTPSGANAVIVVVDTSTGPNDYSTEGSRKLEMALGGFGRNFGTIGATADFATFIRRTGDNTNDDQLCSALAFFSDDWTIVEAAMLVSQPVFEALVSDGRSALAEHSLLVCAATMMGLNVQATVSRDPSSATVFQALRTLYGDHVSTGEASLSRIKEMIGE
jgi:hypothetical protein